MTFDYSYIKDELAYFKNVFSVGQSNEGRDIWCISIGSGESVAVFAAAFHALEHLSAPSLLYFAKRYMEMTDYHDKLRVLIVPMVNPDGVEIAVRGISPKNNLHKDIITHTGILDFKNVWQSNSRGVDINHNFNADWNRICPSPSATKYGGPYPKSEPETRAIVNLLQKTEPELFIAFHSQGKEIYYDFNGMENQFSKANAEAVAKECGYTAATPTGTASFGGAKDWYIKEYHKQAFTVELGIGKNPLPITQLDEMKNDTFKICMGFIDRIFNPLT